MSDCVARGPAPDEHALVRARGADDIHEIADQFVAHDDAGQLLAQAPPDPPAWITACTAPLASSGLRRVLGHGALGQRQFLVAVRRLSS